MKKKCALGGTLFLTIALTLCGCSAESGTEKADGEYKSVLSGEILEAVSEIKTKEVDYNKAVYVELAGKQATVTAIGKSAVNEMLSEEAPKGADEAPAHGLRLVDGVLFVETEGDYVLSGQFTGQIQINASNKDKVHLILNGLSIACEKDSAIYGVQSDRIYITLAEGSKNTISDASTYVYESEDQDEPNAAIFSKDDLTFDGTGSLVVNGNFEDGIRSKDDLAIVGGNYEVNAVKDALQGKDSVCITGGNFILKSGEDAIKSSNDTEAEKGYVVINGGTFSIQAGDDGVHGESGLLINDCKMDILSCYEGLEARTIEINGGEFLITASDDGLNAAYNSSEEIGVNAGAGLGRGGQGGFADGGGSMIPDESCKIGITGGKITISAGGDGIDSNGYLYVAGGEVYVNSSPRGADGAIDCGMEAVVTGGTMVALGASGMATGFSANSSQCFIFCNIEEQAASGEMLILSDKDGNQLLSYVPTNAYNSVLISCPSMQADSAYTLSCGEQETKITLSGTYYSEGGAGPFGGNGFGNFGDFRGGQDGFGGRGQRPEMDGGRPSMPEGMTPPEGWEPGQMPEGMTPPEDWEPGQMPQK